MSVSQDTARGAHFRRRDYRDRPLPDWQTARLQLPVPTLPDLPGAEPAYWKAWELAFAHTRRPLHGGTLVSNYVDTCTEGRLRLWDAAATSLYCNLAHDLLPAVRSLDNFYRAQHPDGEICVELEPDGGDREPWINREGLPLFSRRTGRAADLGRTAPVPELTLDGSGPPLLAWAEREAYRHTGDSVRVREVWEALLAHHTAIVTHLRHVNGLYVSDGFTMENSPRNAQLGCGIDISCQMVLSARCLAELAPVAAREAEADGQRSEGIAMRRAGTALAQEAEDTAAAIRNQMWDEDTGFFYDLRGDGQRSPVMTAAAFWALLAGVATSAQADRLAAALEDPRTFLRPHRLPSLAASMPGYDPRGGFWRGAVWPPLVPVVTRGLERYGHGALAHAIALNHIQAVAEVCAETGTLWENYAAEATAPGRPARPDFVGWSGLGPILLLLEYGIGLRANAALHELTWEVRDTGYLACERYLFGRTRVDVEAIGRSAPEDPLQITVTADRPIRLIVRVAGRERILRVTGRQELTI